MPVIRDHYISHQWLRELRRSGARVLVGVYFRLPDDEVVWAGRYNQPHERMPLGAAIAQLGSLSDPLGYEVFIERKIYPREITKIRHLPQNIGWRYQPHANGKEPCPCPVCLPIGAIKSRKIRERLSPNPPTQPFDILKAKVESTEDIDSLIESLWALRSRRRSADPAFLERLLAVDDAELQEELARTLGRFRHRNSRRLLLALCEHPSADVKQEATESLLQIYRQDTPAILGSLAADPVIGKALADAAVTIPRSAP
jgi:hypothetical protein